MWTEGVSHQTLSLKNVAVQIRVGVGDSEKFGPQRVEVDVMLSRRCDGYRGEGLKHCMNYESLYHYLTENWPKRGHLELLEAWAEDLVGFCFRDHKVEACRVRLRKTEVFPGSATPEIDVLRYRRGSAQREG
jgi:dihydroneopterin aldolase